MRDLPKPWNSLILAACLNACAPAPPHEPGPFRPQELVELADSPGGPRLEVRYATADNFLGHPVYAQARFFLQKPAAAALLRVHAKLGAQGLGLLLFDGYRPWSVTRLFWEAVTEAQRPFVADPSQGSRHNRGCAVDLSLYDLRTGEEIAMPSAYDEMNEKAYPQYAGGTAKARAMRDLLRAMMESEGFSVYPTEWWHFDYRDWREYEILDLPFEAIAAKHEGR
jgi:D-alanyl-D-alanine dipeptidase